MQLVYLKQQNGIIIGEFEVLLTKYDSSKSDRPRPRHAGLMRRQQPIVALTGQCTADGLPPSHLCTARKTTPFVNTKVITKFTAPRFIIPAAAACHHQPSCLHL
jgi:hypothetical protein